MVLHKGFFQNFESDVYHAFTANAALFVKYEYINIIFPTYSNHPSEIVTGISSFAVEQGKDLFVTPSPDVLNIIAKTVFIVLSESDLAHIIKSVQTSNRRTGKDVGIVSFNETIFKELLNITVVTTDFMQMGHSLATMVLENQDRVVNNPFKMIVRGSL